ncbi:MAG: CAP domain-containing protein [Rhodobacteraceae bacterium]|jgi:uncharacterized protein YkwD|nr:CAP domain-containing protein [Paracoccaceae bacterium]
MFRLSSILLSASLLLAACAAPQPTMGPDGKPLPKLYKIGAGDVSKIQFRMLDSVNSLRQAVGAGSVEFDSQLNAAAATHARDMSLQNRPWHFGSDGSSPIDRATRVGFSGLYIGEALSETYETEGETLAAWMDDPVTRRIIVDSRANRIGFAWFQETNGKIWWVMEVGAVN